MYAAAFRMFGVPRPRKSKAPLPSGVRSVSPCDDGGDGFERHAQFFGNNLAVCGERGALTEVALAGANQDRCCPDEFRSRKLGSVGSSVFLKRAPALSGPETLVLSGQTDRRMRRRQRARRRL